MILCVSTTPAVQRTMVFDRLDVDEVNRAIDVRETAAGKGINVAHVLSTLGRKVLVTGFIGGDTGRLVLADLDRDNVPHRFVEVPFRTRTCVTLVDRSAGTITELVEESKLIESVYWRELEKLIETALGECEMLALSGSLPSGFPQDFYAKCASMATAKGVPFIVDSKGEPLRLTLPCRPKLAKPNREELAATLGVEIKTDEQLKDGCRRLFDLGAESVLITMGGKNAVFFDGRSFFSIGTPKVKVSNPIGSGDSVTAGFAAGFVEGLQMIDCAVLGIACGAANAMTDDPGVVRREDVVRLQSEIRMGPFE